MFRKKDPDSVVCNSHKRMQFVIKRFALPSPENFELPFQGWIKFIEAAPIEPGVKREELDTVDFPREDRQ